MKDGFITVGAGNFAIRAGDPAYNGGAALAALRRGAEQGVKVMVLPRLCLTGATLGDLYRQEALLAAAWDALLRLAANAKSLDLLAVVGLPVRQGGRLYDCAAAIGGGEVLWLCPRREAQAPFSPGPETGVFSRGGSSIPLGWGYHLACLELSGLELGIGLEEDVFETRAPVLLNPAAAFFSVEDRTMADLNGFSHRCGTALLRAGAGEGESTTNGVMDGRCAVLEAGESLNRTGVFETGLAVAQLDLERVSSSSRGEAIPFSLGIAETQFTRTVNPSPFLLPQDRAKELAQTILSAQAKGLAHRMERAFSRRAVIGISGGVDSTLALLVAVRAMELLGWDSQEVLAVTMPCFGTSNRTYQNAQALCRGLGVELREIPLGEAVAGHLRDIGHDGVTQDAAYENAQARERTQVLMDLANMEGGLVVGTGDLSELALGWATYNGDHMSMYGVNANLPKTLIRQMLLLLAQEPAYAPAAEAIRDIVDTPVSPELLPGADGEIGQITEEVVGPYELHDFFLYHCLKYGSGPRKILRLAERAFHGRYEKDTILRWMELFYKRFFAAQFKRSCLPDGPGVYGVGLSPRGQWVMPSDAYASIWLNQVEELMQE